MFTNLSRIIKYGVQNFWRNGWLSVATIAVMVLVLLPFEGLLVFGVVGNAAIDQLQDKIDISVYFKAQTSEDDILKLEKVLQGLGEVKSVSYISRDKALEIFKEKHKDEAVITNALAELDQNPLLASLSIKAQDPNNYSTISSYLQNDNLSNIVEKVDYTQNRLVIDRLAKIVETVRKLGFGLIVFLSVVAALVIFNTIRIAIYSNREEISILRLVGASNGFVNGPFLVSAALYGIFGAVLSLILSIPVIIFLSPYLTVFMPTMSFNDYFLSNILFLFGSQLVFGIGLGVISSTLSIRRYLRI